MGDCDGELYPPKPLRILWGLAGIEIAGKNTVGRWWNGWFLEGFRSLDACREWIDEFGWVAVVDFCRGWWEMLWILDRSFGGLYG